jgi:hypothetical protein
MPPVARGSSASQSSMFAFLKRPRKEEAVRQALAVEFTKVGLDFTSFDPTIQRTMVLAALASGSVQKQVEGFTRVTAKIAEQDDLSHELKRELVVRAYAELGERLSKEASKD